LEEGERMMQVFVRWWDGYSETFEATEVRGGAYLLWMRLKDGHERCIPLNQVRWYSKSIESHQAEKPLS
jgi:hypothetical protein